MIDRPPLRVNWSQPTVRGAARRADGESWYQIYRVPTPDGVIHVERILEVGDYYLYPDAIHCHPADQADADEVMDCFLSHALSLWFELRGQPAIHAGSVALPEGAVLFSAVSGGGKSTMTAHFVAAGYPLIADDVTIFAQQDGEIVAPAGYPQMKMTDATASRYIPTYEALPPVNVHNPKRRVPIGTGILGRMAGDHSPVKRLYLLERFDPTEADAAITITPILGAAGLMEWLRASMVTWFVEPLGLQKGRMDFFAKLLKTAKVCRLRYPSGLEHLDAVQAAIVADVAND
ncbi:MAG TPA: hypothetical protein PLD47_11220 [Aggregatilineales bacterium]|nr:hypothetical protein [Anaerolineales bacterium]HRE48287.1 hypothetical protein [Aggregatilineales bacterium]